MPDISKQRMTAEELRKAREASYEMGDIELQMDIAPLLNYQGPIDMSRARFHAIATDNPVNKKGFTVPDDYEDDPVYGVYKDEKVLAEPGTVNVIGTEAARPEIWAHEFRHKQSPKMNEKFNRLADAASATNEREWESAVEMWQDQLHRDAKRSAARRGEKDYSVPTMSESERDLLDELNSKNGSAAYHVYRREFERGAKVPEDQHKWWRTRGLEHYYDRAENVFWPKRKEERDELDDWSEELEARNKKRNEFKLTGRR